MELSAFDDFEDSAKQNGVRYWDALELMERLGYESFASFKRVINKAAASCAQLDISIHEAFIPASIILDGKPTDTFKLTRFACFLTSMHADDKKPQVAAAKAYFAGIAASIIEKAIADVDLQRLEVREELKTGEKILSGAAKDAGITGSGYAFFKDAGIRGMYNMSLSDLKTKKGVSQKVTLYDFMGATELAGNYFRVTQTAERIKSKRLRGLPALEVTAKEIGSSVRKTMMQNSGIAPEELPISEDLNSVKKRLKSTHRGMKKLDKASPKALKAKAGD